MTNKHIVYCSKLKKEAEGLDETPYPGALGQKIYHHISKEAWQQWQQRQTMIINEYRLNMAEKEARKFLTEQMEAFLFADSEVRPAGYQEPTSE
jgi:Fe-S cluster biosynthesis and repair protein YggX